MYVRPQVIGVDYITPGVIPNDPLNYLIKILAEGDSWFSIGAIPSSNILFEMQFQKTAAIVNCAHPGDTIKNMADILNNFSFRSMLGSYDWNGIVMSGGGNDLIGSTGAVLLGPGSRPEKPQPRDYVDGDALRKAVQAIQDSWRKVVGMRDADPRSAGKPIVIHTYDYCTPRNAPAQFLSIPAAGPWLYPAMVNKRIPEDDMSAVSDILINEMAEALLALDSGAPGGLPRFYVVDTRHTLLRALPGTTATSGDWLNEIHPTAGGYTKIAQRLTAKLNSVLLGAAAAPAAPPAVRSVDVPGFS